ncbi:hypothetical protein VSS74_07300 [Conexibacter stalactiti]|uniref:Uncharacterized protein n=1 Tax=Conexibacter stalactiti TaxID=1940611 RepID=A0ABU4HN58_9ACTN|nr:hypothetical protein [Conexibacter stalactiti]MDW5594134.1 hypothetical protein [Conexibacter stalactiti]MEC5034776.1 hypothetical protein [Conexibacter stalactiti]
MLSIPGSTRRLSEGVALKASVIARLLGIRLLTLDATVLVAPAEIAAATTVPPPSRSSPLPALPSPSPSPSPRTAARSRPVGDGLREAERCIEEGAASLAAARSVAPSRR